MIVQRKAEKITPSVVADPPKPKPKSIEGPKPAGKLEKMKPAVVVRNVDNDMLDDVDEVQL